MDGVKDDTKTTQQDCESAGGTWNASIECTNVCMCCSYRYLCTEKVWSYYEFDYSSPGSRVSDPIPTSQPAGTLRVWSTYQYYQANTGVSGCAGTSPGRQNRFDTGDCYNPNVCDDWTTAYGSQWYYRVRVVDDCSECVSGFDYPFGEVISGDCDGSPYLYDPPCFTGPEAVSCTQITKAACQSSGYKACADSLEVSLCENPLP